MRGEDGIHRKTLEQAVGHHRQGTGAALFGRLEDQHDGAVELRMQGQVPRRSQQHRRMAVVAAGMHSARVLAGMGEAVVLFHRQRIHVGAQTDGALALAALQNAHNTGAPDASHHRNTPTLQQLGHTGGRALFGKAQLRMCVQVAADGHELRRAVLDVANHDSFPSKPVSTFATLTPSTSTA